MNVLRFMNLLRSDWLWMACELQCNPRNSANGSTARQLGTLGPRRALFESLKLVVRAGMNRLLVWYGPTA